MSPPTLENAVIDAGMGGLATAAILRGEDTSWPYGYDAWNAPLSDVSFAGG